MRGFPQRIILWLACFIALAGIMACPKPTPPPVVNPPDASDAARPPKVVSCATACKHAEAVCPSSGSPCLPACGRVGVDYARCVDIATGCPGLKHCDPLAP